MKTQHLKIQVPEPCHEDWNEMTPKDKGAFCSSCEKVVVDFTKMTDRQLVDFLDKNKGKKTCGKFNSFQVDRNISVTTPKPNYFWNVKQFFVGLLVSLSFPGFTKAEKISPNFTPLPTLDDKDTNNESVQGVVVDYKGNKIAAAYIRIYQNGRITQAYTVTDETGAFKLALPTNFQEKNIELKITAQNFISESVQVTSEDKLEVVMIRQEHILGKMAFTPIEVEESSEIVGQTVVYEGETKAPCEVQETKGEVQFVEVPPQSLVEVPVIDIMGDIAIEYPENFLPQNITGLVVDEYGEPIPFANVLVENQEVGVVTDIDGKFNLELPYALRGVGALNLTVSLIGFEQQIIPIKGEDVINDELNLKTIMLYQHYELMGIMIMEPPQGIEKPSNFDSNYQEPEWKEAGFNSRKEYNQSKK